MDFNLILILLAIVVGVYLIFKFIKKLVFAVFTAVFLFVAVIGGVFGLVYLDFNQLSSQTDFDIDVIYVNEGNYAFGTQIMVRNNSQINLTSVKGISGSDLSAIDINKITKEDNLFVVEVDSVLFNSLIENNTFSFNQFASNDALSSFTLEFTGSEISNLLVSTNAKNEFVTLLLDKNNMKGIIRETVKPIINSEITNLPFDIKQLLFLAVMQESLKNKDNILTLLKAYKNDNGLAVYPDRYSFKLLKMLPVDTIQSYIPSMPTNPLN